jgi:NodT family efflux transporter outer membrane factor (OMF) lipoprotein
MGIRHLLPAAAALTLAACAVGPDYRTPELKVADRWQAPLPHGGRLDGLTDWWAQFNDPLLTELQQAAQANSPTLAQAEAAIRVARAGLSGTRAAHLPTLTVSAGSQESGDTRSDADSITTTRQALDAAWELDLFGRVRRSVESAEATAEAREADWHDARVSVAAEVAAAYVDYRACRLKSAALEQGLASQRTTEKLTLLSVEAGFTRASDGELARAGAAGAANEAIAQSTECELLIKSLVALTGWEEPKLRERLGTDPAALPLPAEFEVGNVPAALLTQRPDIIAAERSLAAAGADIGVAEANRWPSLTLTGTIAISTAAGVETRPWGFGPTLSLPLFQGGALRARVRSAEAGFDRSLAAYRQTVIDAVKEVEQALVRLDGTARRVDVARASAAHYRNYFEASDLNWRAGRDSLLDLETARRSALAAEISLISLQQSRVNTWISLYKAMGGGWHSASNTNPSAGAQP